MSKEHLTIETYERIVEALPPYRERPKNRIPLMLNALEAAWRLHPDSRLGQLIVNAVSLKFKVGDNPFDPFYLEDHQMMEALTDFANRIEAASKGEKTTEAVVHREEDS